MGKEKDAKASPAKKDATKSPSKSSSKVKKETGNGLKLRSYAACSTFYQTITVGFLGQFRSINFDSLNNSLFVTVMARKMKYALKGKSTSDTACTTRTYISQPWQVK